MKKVTLVLSLISVLFLVGCATCHEPCCDSTPTCKTQVACEKAAIHSNIYSRYPGTAKSKEKDCDVSKR